MICKKEASTRREENVEERIRNKRSTSSLPNGCPTDFTASQSLPHEDCDKFYQCSFGIKVQRECRDGLHFNARLEVQYFII